MPRGLAQVSSRPSGRRLALKPGDREEFERPCQTTAPRRGATSSTQMPLNAASHRRAPVAMPGCHRGRPPKNKGLRFPADPPTVDEISAVMRASGDGANGARLRALIVVWRAGLRISEALALAETDLPAAGAPSRQRQRRRRREVSMDR